MRLKNGKLILGMLCAWLVLSSCNDDEENVPNYHILGSTKVDPEVIGNYSVDEETGEFSWSTSDTEIAEVLSSSGVNAEVQFNKSGLVRLNVTDGQKTGYLDILVTKGSAEVIEIYFGQSGVVNESATDTVFFQFDAPLAEVSSLVLNGENASDTSAFFTDDDGEAISPFYSSGQSLSELTQYDADDLTLYYAVYQGGSGNGQPEGILESIQIKESFGGDEIENFYFKLPIVDNLAPVGTVEFSKDEAKNGDEITITVNFNEDMRPKWSDAADTLVFVDISGGSVTTKTDTLWATNDPSVWTLRYTVDGEGDGNMTVSVGDIVDLGGNVPVSLEDGILIIDNTAPVASGSASVVPNSQAISIVTDGYWLVVEAGSDAPTALDDFGSGGYGDKVLALESGSYDVYYIATDDAGNESEVVSELGVEI